MLPINSRPTGTSPDPLPPFPQELCQSFQRRVFEGAPATPSAECRALLVKAADLCRRANPVAPTATFNASLEIWLSQERSRSKPRPLDMLFFLRDFEKCCAAAKLQSNRLITGPSPNSSPRRIESSLTVQQPERPAHITPAGQRFLGKLPLGHIARARVLGTDETS
jgi:hypothetical protein